MVQTEVASDQLPWATKPALLQLLLLLSLCPGAEETVINAASFGAKCTAASDVNRDAINAAVSSAAPGDTILLSPCAGSEKEHFVLGGIVLINKTNVTLHIDANVRADDCAANRSRWPLQVPGAGPKLGLKGDWYMPLILIAGCSNVTLTGSGRLDGAGIRWWDDYLLGIDQGRRRHPPNLIEVHKARDVVVERLRFLNSPHFNLFFRKSERVVVRYLDIDVDRSKQRDIRNRHRRRRAARAGLGWLPSSLLLRAAELFRKTREGVVSGDRIPDAILDAFMKLIPAWVLQPEDLNTDGIDPQGKNFHIHDCTINNDDDSIAVKPGTGEECTENILIENMVLTGAGAAIGTVVPSANHSCIRNVTFRNISLPDTAKGIYIKADPGCGVDESGRVKTGEISNILYEDVRILRPAWWPIWIGPQQQQEPGTKLSKCSLNYPINRECPTVGCVTVANVTLRRVLIVDPLLSPGVVLGNRTNPFRNITLDGLRVRFSGDFLRGSLPFGRHLKCENAQMTILNGSSGLVPKCVRV